MFLGDARTLRREPSAFRRRAQQVLDIGGNVVSEGEGQRILNASRGGERLVDEGPSAIEVAGDRVGEPGINTVDDQGRLTVLAQAGVDRQTGAGADALLEGVDRLLKAGQAEAGGAQRAIGQAL